MSKFHYASPSKSVSETPSSNPIFAAQILSNLQLLNWRGSLTTFTGFTCTRPDREFESIPWNEACNLLCPKKPAIIEDKKQGQFFVPCLLKEAPFVGNTLEFAKKNGKPTIGKMRSKSHVTHSEILIIDIDGLPEVNFGAGLAKIRADNITFLAYTTHSHGSAEKPGMRVRLIILLDRQVTIGEYAAAWHGFDQYYWQGGAGKADASGANLYQQQGTWCCHPSRVDQAQSWNNEGGIASADGLIVLSRSMLKQPININLPKYADNHNPSHRTQYPPADAIKIADRCKQIGAFRDTKGADHSEPQWYENLGVVGYCENGEELCQTWSSGHSGYDRTKTKEKLAQRLKFPPTTCDQFKKSNPSGCQDCVQKCNSPIKLGWLDTFEHSKISDSSAVVISPTDEEMIASLAGMKPMEYDRLRLEKAKELNVQVKTLDELVKEARKEETQSNQLLFSEIEPYPNPINLALLLDEISENICRFVIADKNQADTAALWIAHTYLIDLFDISPIAIINAPEKACAKTLFQTLLARMSYRPLPAANASASALFWAVESWKPTIFFDEADTFFRNNLDLQGLVNAGYKRGGYVLRSESTGESFEPRRFSVYCAKSIAGISLEGHLPDSTMSRGIIFNMRRKLSNETVIRMRNADSGVFDVLASKLIRFALDYSQQIRLARPSLPDALSDRSQDNWEALLAIAECAGVEWFQRAKAAALKLSCAGEASVSTGNELLADIRDIFESKGVEKISSVELIEALVADDESPWATYNRGRQITPRQLAKMLAGYGIKSKTVRLGHANTPKGYDTGQFADAFARYLLSKLPQQHNVSLESKSSIEGGVADKTQHDCPIGNSITLEPLLVVDCGDVSNKTQLIDY